MLLCLFVRRRCRSPLFPYTTLFRSRVDAVGKGRERTKAFVVRGCRRVDRQPEGANEGREPGGDAEDRKSTRLNSSHGYISYAVFCLKKKNDTKQQAGCHERGRELDG